MASREVVLRMETNANADLVMRVKALEADVAVLQRQNARLIEAYDELQQRVGGLTGVVEILIDDRQQGRAQR